MPVHSLRRLASLPMLAAVLASPTVQAAPTQMTMAVISLAGDVRHASRRMERGYPGHPQGRALQGVQLALEEAAFEHRLASEKIDITLPGRGSERGTCSCRSSCPSWGSGG